MATRSIVTSHPDVACDVCGRRLLRGEQPDVFLSGGQRRTVCELCAPRAAHEGWLREADQHSLSLRSSPTRRTRSLFGRLRQLREPDGESQSPLGSPPIATRSQGDHDEGLYDFLDDSVSSAEPVAGEQSSTLEPSPAVARPARAAATSGDLKVARALEVFNSGEHPRRVAGVARSLGPPSIRVAPAADAGPLVTLVVAWELCWYRYEVDLGDEAAGARLAGEGMELEELAAEDRLANAVADERGELSLLG
jgi:hypothetical protein